VACLSHIRVRATPFLRLLMFVYLEPKSIIAVMDTAAQPDGQDNRQVVLLKSRETKNRFYTLAPPETGWRNAEEVDEFPPGYVLGIAYPCLEDGLNDFAIIRTTFETLEVFPEDEELQGEMMTMIHQARDSLVIRLTELRDRLDNRDAHFLGTDLEEFKRYARRLCKEGTDRRTLDSMMKVNVFQSVAQAHEEEDDYSYVFKLLPQNNLDVIGDHDARKFVVTLFHDIILSVQDDSNYWDKNTFDKNVFQKFIALMFVNYATTDPVFYGTNKEDYGVDAGRDMTETPLYRAVGVALRKLEREEVPVLGADEIEGLAGEAAAGGRALEPASEHQILGPLMSMGETLRLLANVDHPRAKESRIITTRSLSQMITQLRTMGVVSTMALHPLEELLKTWGADGAEPEA
jgi:hypothetical protein